MRKFALPLFSTTLPLLLMTGVYWMLADVTAFPEWSPQSVAQSDTSTQTEQPFFQEKVFGYSTERRPVRGYVIGRGSKTIFLFGGIHGNEKGTVTLMEHFAEELRANPSLVPSDKRVVIIPLANPDGYLTRSDKLNAHAANLNRNFLTDDWIKQEVEDDPETYAGQRPFSEVESRLIAQVTGAYQPSIMVAYHSQGALVSPEFNESSIELGKWYAEKTGYEYFDEWDYAGTATRWYVDLFDGAAITIELTTHEESDWEINKVALLELLKR